MSYYKQTSEAGAPFLSWRFFDTPTYPKQPLIYPKQFMLCCQTYSVKFWFILAVKDRWTLTCDPEEYYL